MKTKRANKSYKQPKEQDTKKPAGHPDSEEEESFSNWIRSEEGIENLKLFVLGNSLIVLIVISWPQIKEALDAAYYMYVEYMGRRGP